MLTERLRCDTKRSAAILALLMLLKHSIRHSQRLANPRIEHLQHQHIGKCRQAFWIRWVGLMLDNRCRDHMIIVRCCHAPL